MTKMRRTPFALAISLLAVGVLAEDWGRWRGPNNDGHVRAGVWIPESLPAEPQILWRVKLGDGYGSPVVAGGRVFCLHKEEGKEVALAVEAASGKELWKKPLDDAADDNQGKGARSTPTVDGERVYLQSCRGEFQCLRAADGELLWRKNFVKDFGALFFGEVPNPKAVGASRHGNNGSPIIDGDYIYVLAGGVDGASVVCLNKTTGELIWKSQSDQAGYGATVIATLAGVKQLVTFTAEGVIGLDMRDGKLLWRVPIKTTWARHATTPTVAGDVVMVSSHEHGLYGIRISPDGSGLKAEQAWLTKEAAPNFASPVAVGDYLYGLGPAKNFICVDTRTGKLAWSHDGEVAGDATHCYAGFLVMGKNILALTDRGQLVLFAANPKEFKEISRAQICGLAWCVPAYADGRLYLRDRKELLCVQLR